MPVFQNILQAIGRTPMVRLNKLVGSKDAAPVIPGTGNRCHWPFQSG